MRARNKIAALLGIIILSIAAPFSLKVVDNDALATAKRARPVIEDIVGSDPAVASANMAGPTVYAQGTSSPPNQAAPSPRPKVPTDVTDDDRLSNFPCTIPDSSERSKWVWVGMRELSVAGSIVARACDDVLVAIHPSQVLGEGWNRDITLLEGNTPFSRVPAPPYDGRLPSGGAYPSVAQNFGSKGSTLSIWVGDRHISTGVLTLVRTEGLTHNVSPVNNDCGSLLQLTVTEQTPQWALDSRARCMGLNPPTSGRRTSASTTKVAPSPTPAPEPAPAPSAPALKVRAPIPPQAAIESRPAPSAPTQ